MYTIRMGYVGKEGTRKSREEREKLKLNANWSRAGVGRKYLHELNCRVYKRLGTATFRPAGIRFNPLSGRVCHCSVSQPAVNTISNRLIIFH